MITFMLYLLILILVLFAIAEIFWE